MFELGCFRTGDCMFARRADQGREVGPGGEDGISLRPRNCS